jgi:hypothetical protein
MHQESEASPSSDGGSLEHLKITVGVAERGNGAAADVLLDADGFAGFVVDEVQCKAA